MNFKKLGTVEQKKSTTFSSFFRKGKERFMIDNLLFRDQIMQGFQIKFERERFAFKNAVII